jgi:hypothetical protein
VYLDKLYPDGPQLFPPGSIGLIKSWSLSIDVLFGYAPVVLCVENFPFNPENAHLVKAEFCRRAGRKSWEEFQITDEERKNTMIKFKELKISEIQRSFHRKFRDAHTKTLPSGVQTVQLTTHV